MEVQVLSLALMKKFLMILVLVALVVIGTLYFFLYYVDSQGQGSNFSYYTNLMSAAVKKDENSVNFIFTALFDKAKDCRDPECQKRVSDELHQKLIHFKDISYYEGTYFIRLNSSGKIEKLFLNGEWKEESVDTPGEKTVYAFLKNPRGRNYLKGFRINEYYSNMVYLADLYSEAEIIMPVIIDNKVIGAIVKAYGD